MISQKRLLSQGTSPEMRKDNQLLITLPQKQDSKRADEDLPDELLQRDSLEGTSTGRKNVYKITAG